VSNPLFRYPATAIVLGSSIFTAYSFVNYQSEHHAISITQTRIIDIAIFTVISYSSIFYNFTWNSDIESLYLLTAIAALLIGVRISVGRINLKIIATQIGLLTLLFRSKLWFHFPVYGQDSIQHVSFIGYISTTGDVIPSGISYYQHYPGSHIFTAVGQLIMSVSPRRAFFLTVGLFFVISLMFVYIFLTKIPIITKNRTFIMVILLLAFSEGHLHFGTELYAQTAADGIFAIFLYLFVSNNSSRNILLAAVVGLALVITHNLAPIIVVGAGMTVLTVELISKILSPSVSSVGSLRTWGSNASIVSIISLMTLYYWTSTTYIIFQIKRAVTIFTPSQATGQQVIESADLSTAPTISILDMTFPPVLMWALPFLFLGLIGVVSFYIVIQEAYENRSVRINKWIVTSIILLIGFSISFAAGGGGPIRRALGILAMVISPLIALVFERFLRNNYTTALLLVILVCGVLSGVFAPTVAVTERTETNFKPYISSQEISALEFAEKSSRSAVTDSYLTGYSYLSKLRDGGRPKSNIKSILTHSDIRGSKRNYQEYLVNGSDPIIYRPHFSSYYRIHTPERKNKVYTSDQTFVYVP
jgi:hypothetical protein